MACTLNKGRIEPCKDVVGGIKHVYFTDFDGYGTVTQDADDQITDMTGTFTAYKYELKGNSSFEQTVNASRENGTVFFEQTLVKFTIDELVSFSSASNNSFSSILILII